MIFTFSSHPGGELLARWLSFEDLSNRVRQGRISNQILSILWYLPIYTFSIYHQTSNISCIKSQNLFLTSSFNCLCPIHWNQVKSQEWRSSWSNTDRWCSNYIWVINNFIAYQGATYIRGFMVPTSGNDILISSMDMLKTVRVITFSGNKAVTWTHFSSFGIFQLMTK